MNFYLLPLFNWGYEGLDESLYSFLLNTSKAIVSLISFMYSCTHIAGARRPSFLVLLLTRTWCLPSSRLSSTRQQPCHIKWIKVIDISDISWLHHLYTAVIQMGTSVASGANLHKCVTWHQRHVTHLWGLVPAPRCIKCNMVLVPCYTLGAACDDCPRSE